MKTIIKTNIEGLVFEKEYTPTQIQLLGLKLMEEASSPDLIKFHGSFDGIYSFKKNGKMENGEHTFYLKGIEIDTKVYTKEMLTRKVN